MNKKQVDEAVDNYKLAHDYDGEVIVLDGFESAFMGVTSNGDGQPRACYDRMIMVEIMAEAMGSEEKATEYFNDNIYSVCLGDESPIFID